MTSARTLALQSGQLTRVGYLDVAIPAEFVGLTSEFVSGVAWGEPDWAESGQVRFGAAAWFADIGDVRAVFDPILAADAFLRADPDTEATQQQAISARLASAGYPVESVNLVLMTHIEGVGATALRAADGTWAPFFPNATYLVSDDVLESFMRSPDAPDGSPDGAPDMEREAWSALIDAGVVMTFASGEQILPGVTAEVCGAHCAGHTVFHFEQASDPEPACFIGHLAISPLHLDSGPCEGFHENPEAAFGLLQALAADGRRLIGPLWPTPGVGRWQNQQVTADH